MRNPALFSRVFNTPLMIHPSKLDAIIAGIGPRWGIEAQSTNIIVSPEMSLVANGGDRKPGYQVINGVAVIEVFGVLAHRGGFQADSSYILGYEEVSRALDSALNDGSVNSILLILYTPGGEVSGAFELAQLIYDARSVKPIKAAISSMAASAGYLIASAASEIAITDTGIAGSIGVVMRHADISKMTEAAGIVITHIYAGAQKIDGNQFEPLSPAVKARYQAEVDSLNNLFINTTSQYRGMDAALLRGYEAGTFTGQAAIAAGLADRIATPDQLLLEMQQNFSNSSRGVFMATEKPAADAAALEQSRLAGYEAGKKDGAAAENARISAIMNHEHAAGREAQAKVLALETDMSAEQAGKVLAVSSVQSAAPAAQGNQFAEAMAAIKNPKVGADDEADTDAVAVANVITGWSNAFGKASAKSGVKR
jgi:signal peptide peptidase SppA